MSLRIMNLWHIVIAGTMSGIAMFGMQACTQAVIPDGDTIAPSNSLPNDTGSTSIIPAGFGSLRQDDLSLHVSGTGLQMRAIPLEESLIRLLTPDSYRAMRDLRESNRQAILKTTQRYGGRRLSVWFISFYGMAPETPFTPMDVTITSSGQEFHPYDIIPLSNGFGTQRLRQRETQNALYLFDGAIQLDQPVTVGYQSNRDDSWEQTLQRIERERTMIRARSMQSR